MSIWYIDHEGGNDANTGASFAQRLKTISALTAAKGLVAGDTARVMASKDATSMGSATWTKSSRSVTLAAGLTAALSTCETAWTASADVTAATSGTRRQGANSCSLAIAAGFTTGKVAYFDLGSTTDFSGFQQVSLWIRANALFASGVFEIKLCSDAAGDTPVSTVTVLNIGIVNAWHPMTLNLGSALSTTVRSIALYAVSDPGTVTVLLDNIIACKAASSDDSISLTSLISKNTTNEAWWGIQSIDGTDCRIGGGPNLNTDGQRTYPGSTESVTTYKREPIRMPPPATSTESPNSSQVAGTGVAPIYYEGGYDRTAMTTQTGYTFLDFSNGNGIVLNGNVKDHQKYNRICGTRAFTGLKGTAPMRFTKLSNAYFCSLVGGGIDCSADSMQGLVVNEHFNAGSDSIAIWVVSDNFVGKNIRLYSLANDAIRLEGISAVIKGVNNYVLNCDGSAVFAVSSYSSGYRSSEIYIYNMTTEGCVYGDIWASAGGNIYMHNCLLGSGTEITTANWVVGSKGTVFSNKHDQITDAHLIKTDGATMQSTASVRHTASGIAWQLSPTSSSRNSDHPVTLSLAKIACTANIIVTVKAWMRRTNTGISGVLSCLGGQIAGVTDDVTASVSVAADTWEELTLTFTPTENGVVEIEALAYGGTTYSLYVDDLTVT